MRPTLDQAVVISARLKPTTNSTTAGLAFLLCTEA